MEAVEDTSLEAAILWLAQTIVASLLVDKLDAWLRQVELADDTEKLKCEIERIETVVAAVKGRAIGNKPLVRSLRRLKELLYDADDVVDELDYCRLQHPVEGVTFSRANEAEAMDEVGSREKNDDIRSSSSVRYRSEAWEHFDPIEVDNKGSATKAKCKYCRTVLKCEAAKGRSVLPNHLKKSKACFRIREANGQPPNLLSDGARNDTIGRKRMRVDEASTNNVASDTRLWDKAVYSERIHQIALELQGCRGYVSEFLKDSAAISDQSQSDTTNSHLKTSSLLSRKVYGRDVEKDYIIRLMIAYESDAVTVLPIVGVAGVGKTAVAQLVFNDPTVKSKFERIWVWVSDNFDKEILTREMLESFSQESHEGIPQKKKRHEGIIGYEKLQRILKEYMEYRSERFLLILDDIWDSMDDYTWKELLSPLQSSNVKGNVILVTTRNSSVSQRIGTVEPIKLGALGNDDSWLLCKAFAFRDENYELHPTLSIIAKQIANKLKGNPLAAETAGKILRKHLTVDHWSSVLKDEDWKSLQHSRGIMTALKLSYDQLPYHLQQCFLYCSIFPNNYQFLDNNLIRIWISQGFVRCNNSSKTLEEIGYEYFIDLVNLGIFEKDERKETTPGDKKCYVMCGVMHDFARLISRTDCAAIDGLECNKILPTIRHLSVLTDSAYQSNGMILLSNKFEEILQSAVTPVRKLRTLILIGKYDPFFFQTFKDTVRKAQCLRVLQIDATYADFNSLCELVNSTHTRYLRLEKRGSSEALLMPLSKFYHLQVLDIGRAIITNDMSSLISMRHLVVKKGPHFMDQNSTFFEMIQLQSMQELVQLGLYQLQNVNGAEARGAKLRDKRHLKKLHLSWDESEEESLSWDESEEESWLISASNNSLSHAHTTGTEREVLECLEPHQNLSHLRVSGYSGAVYPPWLATSVTCLQTLHLEDCREWQIFPSLGRLPFLTKLKLRNMQKVEEVSIPSLEELVLIKMPNLKKCSCNSVRDLNNSLRVLKIETCDVLEVFPLFESCGRLKIEQRSWLSRIRELTIHDCPHLMVPNPLPPSSSVCKLSIVGVSTLLGMVGSSDGNLRIHDEGELRDESYKLIRLDDKIMSFHNLKALTCLEIAFCSNLSSISLEGFGQLISLKGLIIRACEKLFSSAVPPEQIYEDMADANFNALPSLEDLFIEECGIAWNGLSAMLRHAPALRELHLWSCQRISGLLMEGKESSLSNLTSAPPRNPDDTLTSSAPDGLLRIPSNLFPSLEKMSVVDCYDLTLEMSKEGFSGFTSLEELTIFGCPKLIPSLVHKDEGNDQGNGRWLLPHSLGKLEIDHSPETLQLLFQENHNCLKKLKVLDSPSLKCLQLHSCTALEGLIIEDCESLAELEGNSTWLKKLQLIDNPSLKSVQLHCCTALEKLEIRNWGWLIALEGLQSLSCLRQLRVTGWPGLPPWLERLSSTRDYELFPRLESLEIDDHSVLTTSICAHLTSLQRLEIWSFKEVRILTDEQETALQFLKSLKELSFRNCENLAYLPMGLHSLPSLKRLEMSNSPCILRLPKTGLPPSLEELEVVRCSKELTAQCRMLATGKLKVKLDWEYVKLSPESRPFPFALGLQGYRV